MFLGTSLALTMLGGALWPMRILSEALLGAAAICAGGFVVTFLARDTYSLQDLRDLEDRESLRSSEFPFGEEFDSIHCLACGELFSAQMPVCPVCGATPGRLG